MENKKLLPFYSVKGKDLFYLEKYKICELPVNYESRNIILKNEGALLTSKINKSKREKIVLVIEPHPDDFSLSGLGYTINRFNAIVLNIFSKTNLKYFTWIDKIKINSEEYEKIRLEESKYSIEKFLGQRFLSLREESIRITSKKKLDIQKNILDAVNAILDNCIEINTLLVPMGIGKHPDHIIVYNTIMKEYSKNNKLKIILYPEYPYARCKKDYYNRIKEIENHYKIKPIVVDIEDNLDNIADAISIYRSQFDDINRNQMLAIIREDFRSIASEYDKDRLSLVYYEVEDKINEN